MSYHADITIIGAGVVGLAVASEVAKGQRDVYVLEKNDSFGQEQSSRNSEVIHAGIYYEPGSLKTQLCLDGNRLLYELCERNGIAYRNCGKIIVATDQVEAEELEKLYSRGLENGAPLQMLSQKEMGQMEPNMKGVAAFYAPTTGIIDSQALMRYFLARARGLGAQIAYRTEAVTIEKANDGYEIGVKGASQESSFTSRVVINCAGLHSGKVSQIAGIDIDEAKYRLNWCKGEFYSVAGGKNRLVNRLIYPVPMAISVGVHVCLDVDWRFRLGPLFYYVNKLDYRVDDSRRKDFLESSMMKALFFLQPADLEPESSGIMAMLQGEGESFRDFVIKHETDRGLPGFINLVGIDTPGMTSSPATARYVARLVDEIL